MGTPKDKIRYIYVVAGNSREYLNYVKECKEGICVMLVDGTVLRGRVHGKIIRIGTYHDR